MAIQISRYRHLSVLGLMALGGLLAGCGGDSSNNGGEPAQGGGGSAPTATTLSGSVAVGAPVSGATVSIKCEAGNGPFTTTTNGNGAYSVSIPVDAFPCALRATGGSLPGGTSALHSFVASGAGGTVNITPITALALSSAVNSASGSSLANWFNSPTGWSQIGAGLVQALDDLRDELVAAGYSVPSSWPAGSTAPFSLAFTPSATPAANTIDRLLEDIQAALEEAMTTFDNLLASYTAGGAFPQAATGGGNGGEPPAVEGAVGKAAITPYDRSGTAAEFLEAVSGTWPVAIHKVPAGSEALYGEGALTVGGTVDNWSLRLEGADGSVIFDRSEDGAFTSNLSSFIGQLFMNHGTATDEFMTVFITPDGVIEGSAGGQMDIQFRNNILAYGEGVPAIFADLAGVWTAEADVLCEFQSPFNPGPSTRVTNTVTITEAGEVTLDGKGQFCSDINATFAWGSRDDFFIPDPEGPGFVLHVDHQENVGVSNGRFQVRFSDIENVTVTSMNGFLDYNGGPGLNQELFQMNNPQQQ